MIEKNIDKNEVIKIEENSSQDSEFFEVTTDKDLFEKLKQYRIKKAKEENVLSYMILNLTTLKEISGRYPLNEEQLKDISGVGPVKIEKYGQDIIKLVKEYTQEKNITPKWQEKNKLKLIIDGDNRKNSEIVLDLLNQNKNIDDICEELEISISTSFQDMFMII